MSSSCGTILSFRYLDSVIRIQACNCRLVFLPIVLMNALSHEKGKFLKTMETASSCFLLPEAYVSIAFMRTI